MTTTDTVIDDHDGYTAHHTFAGQDHDPEQCSEMWQLLDELSAGEPPSEPMRCTKSGTGLWGVWDHTEDRWRDQGFDLYGDAADALRRLGGDPQAGPLRVRVECHEHPGVPRDDCTSEHDPWP